jgi:hypothetical protein
MGYVHRWSYEAQQAFPALKKQQESDDAFGFKITIAGCIVMALIAIAGAVAIITIWIGAL